MLRLHPAQRLDDIRRSPFATGFNLFPELVFGERLNFTGRNLTLATFDFGQFFGLGPFVAEGGKRFKNRLGELRPLFDGEGQHRLLDFLHR